MNHQTARSFARLAAIRSRSRVSHGLSRRTRLDLQCSRSSDSLRSGIGSAQRLQRAHGLVASCVAGPRVGGGHLLATKALHRRSSHRPEDGILRRPRHRFQAPCCGCCCGFLPHSHSHLRVPSWPPRPVRLLRRMEHSRGSRSRRRPSASSSHAAVVLPPLLTPICGQSVRSALTSSLLASLPRVPFVDYHSS